MSERHQPEPGHDLKHDQDSNHDSDQELPDQQLLDQEIEEQEEKLLHTEPGGLTIAARRRLVFLIVVVVMIVLVIGTLLMVKTPQCVDPEVRWVPCIDTGESAS